MEVVAGLSLKNLQPRVWDLKSAYHLPGLTAVMVSYADFHQMPARMKKAMKIGLHAYLGVPKHVKIYLDNGAFYFLRNSGQAERVCYRRFIRAAKPDWYPIPFDSIPTPCMSEAEQRECFNVTMKVNVSYQHDGYVPVIHIGRLLGEYVTRLQNHPRLAQKPRLALGGIVPNLLRAPKALPFDEIVSSLRQVRTLFANKEMHVFGIGGTATLHVAALLGINSLDSSGWRNRAARGIVQLPGSGDRMIADLGKWRGRAPSETEWAILSRCRCPACRQHGVRGLKRGGIGGFAHRATHNLWILLEEAKWIDKHLTAESYEQNYSRRLDNTTYLPLIRSLVNERERLVDVGRRKRARII